MKKKLYELIGSPVYRLGHCKGIFHFKPHRLTLKCIDWDGKPRPAIYCWGYWAFCWDKRVTKVSY